MIPLIFEKGILARLRSQKRRHDKFQDIKVVTAAENVDGAICDMTLAWNGIHADGGG